MKLHKSGLLIVILVLGLALSLLSGSHVERESGRRVNNFLNSYTLMQTATDASFFAVMAVGATMVIISGGIDLSVGAVYALSGVLTAMLLRQFEGAAPPLLVLTAIGACLGIGLLCGLLNGAMIVGLRVHPFVITLGTMWAFRGIAFVASKANSILVPDALTGVVKSTLGFGGALYPVPLLVMLSVTALGAVFLGCSVGGRHVYSVGGNIEASRYAGLRVDRVLIGVYAISGLAAGVAALLGSGYYGSASCADATGYELYVIASAVVGGASLRGGRGGAVNAMLGALLIVLIRQSIRTLHFDQNYEWIIIGCAIIIAVVLDRMGTRMAKHGGKR